MANPVEFYVKVLKSLGCIVDDETGVVTYKLYNEPILVNDKRLVVPYDHLLRKGVSNDVQFFHPLCESAVRDPSPVLKCLRGLVHMRSRDTFAILLEELMSLAADSSRHATIAPRGAPLLQLLADVTPKTVAGVQAIIKALENDGQKQLVNVYIRQGGIIDGKSYKRSAIISFPFVEKPEEGEEIDPKDNSIIGVKLGSKKDKKAILALADFILPKMDVKNHYSAGSMSDEAPYFCALLMAYSRLQERFNSVVHMYRKHIPVVDELKADLDWVEELDDLQKFRGTIPLLPGNDGEAPAIAEVQKPEAVAPVQQQQQQRPAPAAGFRALEPQRTAVDRRAPANEMGFQPVNGQRVVTRMDQMTPEQSEQEAFRRTVSHVMNNPPVRDMSRGFGFNRPQPMGLGRGAPEPRLHRVGESYQEEQRETRVWSDGRI